MKWLSILVITLLSSAAWAFDWSAKEYVEHCSVVYQTEISDQDSEIVGYCMGVLKGATAGVIYPKVINAFTASENLELPSCLFSSGKITFWEIQKDVVAKMRLNNRLYESHSLPDTANFAVTLALTELYPCLLPDS